MGWKRPDCDVDYDSKVIEESITREKSGVLVVDKNCSARLKLDIVITGS
jgi:hypothetical protein